MKKLLLIAVATLVVGAVTASAAALVANETVDSLTGNAYVYQVQGVWDTTTPTGVVTATDIGPFWKSSYEGSVVFINFVPTYVLSVSADHLFPSPGLTATASLGLMNVYQAAGSVVWSVAHNSFNGDHYTLAGSIDPVGQYNFQLDAKCDVPEPASFALIAGLGLIGFAGFRRMRA